MFKQDIRILALKATNLTTNVYPMYQFISFRPPEPVNLFHPYAQILPHLLALR